MNKLIKTNIYKILLILILLLSTLLTIYKFNVNPVSLDWDEASLGYNAYSILKTGADEYGNAFPLSIRSFDDYKPPLYVYLDVPSVAFFGLNETGVRFPSALLGILSVLVIYLLTKELFENHQKKQVLALGSAFFFALSPWHLQFSRAAFEGNIGLFFFLLGFWLFVKSLRSPKAIVFSAFAFVLSIYSYHSFRLITPLFVFISVCFYWKEILKNKKLYLLSLVITILLSLPVFLSFFGTGGSSSRLSMVSIYASPEILNNSIKELQIDKANHDIVGELFHNRRVVYFLSTAKSYFDNFNPDFLFFNGDGGKQHHAVSMGMLYFWDLPFILLGFYIFLKTRTKRSLLLLIMFILAPFPSAVSTGSPHPVRAIALSPVFSILTALGFSLLLRNLKNLRNKVILFTALVFFLLNFIYYLHQYYVHTPLEYGFFWQYGNKEAVLKVKQLESGYRKIVFTYQYDQPYIYYLFWNKIDPNWYQKNWNYQGNYQTERMRRLIGKYEFRNINFGQDSKLKNTLLIGSPEEIPANAKGIIDTIYFPDGRVAYRIVGT